MHIAIAFAALWLLAAASSASAQPYPGVGTGPKLGELEIKVYQKIPKAKVAVSLTSDHHLARELRRQVRIRLSQRGNEVGFSGGNVMRMDVSYFDLLGGNDRNTGTIGGQPDYAPPGSNPRPALPSNPIGRRDGARRRRRARRCASRSRSIPATAARCFGRQAVPAPRRPTSRSWPARRSSTTCSTTPTRTPPAMPAAHCNWRKSSDAASGPARPRQAHARTEEG